MAEDNNRDAKQISRKDARREAKIEAKRRKLAEQRAEKAAAGETAAAGSSTISGSIDAPVKVTEPVIKVTEPVSPDPPMKNAASGNADQGTKSQRTWYDADREIIKPFGAEKTSAPSAVRTVTADSMNTERRIRLNQDGEAVRAGEEKTGSGQPEKSSVERKSGIRPKLRRKPRRPLITRKSFANWIRNMTPAYAARLLLALAVLIGLIYGALELADYYDKKTDYRVTDKGYTHAAQFDGCAALNGIDVSVHQDGEIQWEKVKTSGVDYVFVRAGYRAADDGSLHEDEKFYEHVKAAKKAGLMVGAYFYSQALTPDEGREEAEFVLGMLKNLKGYDLNMPVAIDYEIYKDGRLDKKIEAGELYAASLYHDIVLGFTETIEKAGYESAVYASRDMLTNYMQADLIDDMATVWLAKYDTDAGLDADYWFWQYTNEGKVGGMEANVDQSFWYMKPDNVYHTRGKRTKNAISIGACRISFQRSSFKLHNFRAEPKYGITYEGKGMKEGRDYVSSVVHNTKEGTGYLIIRGIGKYKDWIMYPFKIE